MLCFLYFYLIGLLPGHFYQCVRQLVVHFTYQEYTTMTNIRIAARTVLPLPKPGDRSELEIKEPLGLHIWSDKNNKDLRNVWYIFDKIINYYCFTICDENRQFLYTYLTTKINILLLYFFWLFQASFFQLLKLENLLWRSFFTLIYNRSSNIGIISYNLYTSHQSHYLFICLFVC